MAVTRFETEAMIDGYEVSVATLIAYVRDGAGRRHIDRLAALTGNIEPCVEIVATGNRIHAMTHGRRQPPLGRPDRRRCRRKGVAAFDTATDYMEARFEAFEQRSKQAKGVFRRAER